MPPWRTRMSIAAPSAGIGGDRREAVGAAALQADREVARPTPSARSTALASGSIACTAAMPASMVLRVPPVSCITKVCSVGPAAELLLLQQALDLVALAAQADHQRRRPGSGGAHSRPSCGAAGPSARRSSPCRSRCAWLKATTPSTFGYSASRSGVNHSAILWTTVAEQFTVDRMPMKLRVADPAVGAHDALEGRALGLRQHLHRLVVAAHGRSRGRTRGTRCCGCAPWCPAAMSVAAKPMVTLYLRIGSPLAIARAAILWPAGTWLRLVKFSLGHSRADRHVDARHHDVVVGVQADHRADHAFGGSCCHGSRKVFKSRRRAD